MQMTESKKKNIRTVLQIIAVVVILLAGVMVFKKLSSMKKVPERKTRQVAAPLLEAQVARVQDIQMTVHGSGTVHPKIQVSVTPQVSGVITSCAECFVDGGFFRAGRVLVTIDRSDYELAVDNAAAAIADAEMNLIREQAEADIALEQWQQLHPGTEPTSPLVLRKPQIRQARAQLQAAHARLTRAKLDLARTAISLPFNGRISQKDVDHGQYVTPGKPIATVYGTDIAEIVVPLEDRELKWFDLPTGYTDGDGGDDKRNTPRGAWAELTVDFAGRESTWIGQVVRTQGLIDPTSRMVNVVIEVEDPFKQAGDRPPLTPGMFVRDVVIKGRTLGNVLRIPRHALHNGSEVWVAADEKLRIKTVQIARQDDSYAYIAEGLDDGDVIITSPLDTATDGMEIRTQITGSAPAQPSAQQDDEK